MTQPSNPLDNNVVRILAIIAAGILLNLGLFFVLEILTPFVVGIICGYILAHNRNGAIVGFLSGFISYSLIFFVTNTSTDLLATMTAILIMGAIGAVGGSLGVYLQRKTIEYSS